MAKDVNEILKALPVERREKIESRAKELAKIAISESNTETRFLARQQSGNPERGLALLNTLTDDA